MSTSNPDNPDDWPSWEELDLHVDRVQQIPWANQEQRDGTVLA
jgi:hypothetical protein